MFTSKAKAIRVIIAAVLAVSVIGCGKQSKDAAIVECIEDGMLTGGESAQTAVALCTITAEVEYEFDEVQTSYFDACLPLLGEDPSISFVDAYTSCYASTIQVFGE